MSDKGNKVGAQLLSAAALGGDNDNNITISHTRGGGGGRGVQWLQRRGKSGQQSTGSVGIGQGGGG